MRSLLRCLGLALALGLLPFALADDKKDPPKVPDQPKDNKDDPKTDPKDEPKKPDPKTIAKEQKEALDKLTSGGEVTGKLIRWESNGHEFTVQVEYSYSVPNAGVARTLADLQVKLLQAKSVQEAVSLRQQIADNSRKLYDLKKDHFDVEFVAAEDMKYRMATPPTVFDDKGQPRKMTKKELEELKGPNPKLPGYTAELSDVKSNQIVTVYRAKKAAKKDDKFLKGEKPEATMILILGDPPPAR
jgi:hypothetical protein